MLRSIRVILVLLFLLNATKLLFGSPPPADQQLPEVPHLSEAQLQSFKAFVRQQFQKAYEEIQGSPEDGEASGRLGMMFHAHGLYEFAATCYQRARLLQPESFRWVYYLGLAQAESGKASQAVGILREAVQLNSSYPPARLKLAESLLATGEWEESGRIYESLVQSYPNSPVAHYGLGQVQSARGELGAAVESYRRACRLWPPFGRAHYALAMAYRNLGEKEKSEEHFSLFQRHKEEKPPVKDSFLAAIHAFRSKEDFHLSEGLRLEEKGHLQQAAVEYERSIEANAHLWAAHTNLVSIYGTLGQMGEAEEHYHAAVKIHPDQWETHANFGLLLQGEDRYQEAADAFKKALEINPFSPQTHSGLASVLAIEGQLEEAIRHCQLALENDPNFRHAHFTLGRILQSQGKNTEAIEHFLQTITTEDQRTPVFLYFLADAYAKSGNRPRAIEYAQQARQRALSFGHTELVADIEGFLQQLKPSSEAR